MEDYDCLSVVRNVLLGISILFYSTMIFIGGILFYDCPTQPPLSITTLAMGVSGLVLTLVTVICDICVTCTRHRVSNVAQRTFTSIMVVLLVGGLIAETHFTRLCGCKDSRLYKASIFFVVIQWLSVPIIFLLSGWTVCREFDESKQRRERERRDYFQYYGCYR